MSQQDTLSSLMIWIPATTTLVSASFLSIQRCLITRSCLLLIVPSRSVPSGFRTRGVKVGQQWTCGLQSQNDPLFLDAVMIFDVTSEKAGAFQTLFRADAIPLTSVAITSRSPLLPFFDGVSFDVVEEMEKDKRFVLQDLHTELRATLPEALQELSDRCSAGAPRRIFGIAASFFNISGKDFTDISFVVDRLTGDNTVINVDPGESGGKARGFRPRQFQGSV